jgi:O-methyltransferase
MEGVPGQPDDALTGAPEAPELYLRLLKGVLTRSVVGGETYRPVAPGRPVKRAIAWLPLGILRRAGLELVRKQAEEKDWPVDAETMIGRKRLDNLQACIEDVLRRRIPGDLIECGVWRGGAVILMRAVLRAYGVSDRSVWAADSFSGFPIPDQEGLQADVRDHLHAYKQLAVSSEEVKQNFERYGLLDDQVQFLVGWFRDTLPTAPIRRLAIMRLDSDRYESTMDSLRFLYPKLSPGGYVIADDYGVHAGCQAATDEFRREHGINEPLIEIDWSGVYWERRE